VNLIVMLCGATYFFSRCYNRVRSENRQCPFVKGNACTIRDRSDNKTK